MNATRRKFITIFTAVLVIFLLPGCVSTPAHTNREQDVGGPSSGGGGNENLKKQIDSGDIFESRNAPPKISTIGIIKPQVPANSRMTANELLTLDIMRNSMSSNFTQFAKGKIAVVNLSDQIDQTRNEEISRSLSGSNDELSLVLRRSARAILTGEIIKQSQIRFHLSFTVIETETGIQLASYNREHSDIEIDAGIAVNRATEDLLKQLNVVLNEAGRFALYGASNAGETALAKGLNAANSGQSLQAMNYFFNAASYDTTASQASARLSSVQNQNRRDLQGEGGRVMDFFQRQTFWQDRINEYNEFYRSHLPFELYYTPPKTSRERVEGGKKLFNLGFDIGLRWNQNQISVMEKVLHEYVLDGLGKNSADEISRWNLKGLPEDSDLFKGPNNFIYNLAIQVENERGDAITSGWLQLYGSLFYHNGRIYALCTQRSTEVFENIEYNESKMTNHLYVRVVSINGINIQTAGESGFLRVVQTQGGSLPPVQPNNLPSSLSNKLGNEQRAQEKKQREEQEAIGKKQREEQKAIDKKNNVLLGTRADAAIYGGYAFPIDAQTINLDFGYGTGYVDLNFGGFLFLGTKKNVDHAAIADNQTPWGFRAGLSLVIPGSRTVFRLSPAYTGLFIQRKEPEEYITSEGKKETKDSYLFSIGSLGAGLDWKPFGQKYKDGLFFRFGYRLDIYPPEVSPIFGKNENKIFMSHSLMAGLVYYMGIKGGK